MLHLNLDCALIHFHNVSKEHCLTPVNYKQVHLDDYCMQQTNCWISGGGALFFPHIHTRITEDDEGMWSHVFWTYLHLQELIFFLATLGAAFDTLSLVFSVHFELSSHNWATLSPSIHMRFLSDLLWSDLTSLLCMQIYTYITGTDWLNFFCFFPHKKRNNLHV